MKLKHCEKCNQMTNHKGNVCLKCKKEISPEEEKLIILLFKFLMYIVIGIIVGNILRIILF